MRHPIQFFLLTLVWSGATILSCDKKEEEFQLKELPGNWIWTASCGGFSGMCSYPDKNNFKSVRITQGRFIEKTNGVITMDTTYEITDMWISESIYPHEKNYELTLGDGRIIGMTLLQHQNKLLIGNNMFTDYYKRQ